MLVNKDRMEKQKERMDRNNERNGNNGKERQEHQLMIRESNKGRPMQRRFQMVEVISKLHRAHCLNCLLYTSDAADE